MSKLDLPQAQPHCRFEGKAIAAFIERIFAAVGIPGDDASRAAALMTEADLVGADAHGIFRLPQYVERIEAGGLNRRPAIVVNRTAPATALVHGDNGLGHLVVAKAADAAVAMARDTGVAWVGVRGSNHAGAASVYAALPLEAGMIGIYSAVASANHMAPWGGADLLLGTNPLAVALPLGKDHDPVVLDMATTVVSYGTVKNYALTGRPMPEGWMIDRTTGEPLTDPANSANGVLLPIGGYKGAGLGLVLGLLAGALNDAAVGADVVDFNADSKTVTNTGQFIVALDVARFLHPDKFAASVLRHLDELRRSARLPGVERIRLPGDDRAARRRDRVSNGVPLSPQVMARLEALAARLGVTAL
ncbi:MAG: Ldh family oxidoreductase [Hyphomicrobiaceae bacterium]